MYSKLNSLLKKYNISNNKIFSSVIIVCFLLLFLSSPEIQDSIVYNLGLDRSISSFNTNSPDVELATVNRVIDGDTILLDDGRTIRYLNIDTPETKRPGQSVQCFGERATQFNSRLVNNRSVVLKKDTEDKDRYNRYLRFVFLEGSNTDNINQSVNALLVRDGYARSLIIDPNDTFESEFIELEREAKELNKGAWGLCENPFEE